MDWLPDCIKECRHILDELLTVPQLPFDGSLRSKLPERPGLYAISIKGAPPGEVLRAGRTKSATGGLRQRVYQNHLMGRQSGNLRTQLIKDCQCSDLEQAKSWIRENCVVQVVVVDDDLLQCWAEHFILSLLRPRYSD